MRINNIRYWDAPELGKSTLSNTQNTQNRESENLHQHLPSFDFSLFDLFGQGGSFSQDMYSNSFFGYNLNSPAQLRQATIRAKEMGMEKVLAAQLASPSPLYGQSYGQSNSRDSNRQYNSYNSLNSIANLTIQLQMAKVQKVIDRLSHSNTGSLEQYISSKNSEP